MAAVEKKQAPRKRAPKAAPKKEAPVKKAEVEVPKGSMRPEALAQEIGISGKILRAWLRKNHTRPAEAKNTAWIVKPEVVKAAKAHFKKQEAK
jgi:hypothetical protein